MFRLLYLQVIDTTWRDRATAISEDKNYTYAVRGIIYDRNGKKLVENATFYDLMIVPKYAKNIDSVAFCKLLNMKMDEFTKKFNSAKKYSQKKGSEIDRQISAEDFGPIAVELYKFPGIYAEKRTLRHYPFKIAPHSLGYLGEVNKREIANEHYYKPRDYIGKQGLEKFYEKQLRGTRGVKYFLKDASGRITGEFAGGKYDTLAKAGENLISSIDAELQQYGEKLMNNKRGCIVAIEPSTGEILSLVSMPGYDPNDLVGKKRGKAFRSLTNNDSLAPLYNRALSAEYSPGSIFKIPQSLIGLQEGVINLNTSIACNKIIGCHDHPTATSVKKAIQYSCNPYYYYAVGRIIQQRKSKNIFDDSQIGLNIWSDYMKSFGFGQRFNSDLPEMKSGLIPDASYYNKMYKGKGRWAYSTIYSISIGQGEVEIVPIQMANLAAIIANRGFYYTPHLIKEIGNKGKPKVFQKKHHTKIDAKHFEPVVEAMSDVVHKPGGTARRARIDSVLVCGKTGTVENAHGEDHSVFMAFAPKENPKIALVVYVENAGFGGTWAAPISSLMIQKYLLGYVDEKKEKRILEKDFSLLTKARKNE